MRRTRKMLAAAAVTLSLSAAGTGVAMAQTPPDPELAAKCASYNFFEWLLFHHECHGHVDGHVYWPAGWG